MCIVCWVCHRVNFIAIANVSYWMKTHENKNLWVWARSSPCTLIRCYFCRIKELISNWYGFVILPPKKKHRRFKSYWRVKVDMKMKMLVDSLFLQNILYSAYFVCILLTCNALTVRIRLTIFVALTLVLLWIAKPIRFNAIAISTRGEREKDAKVSFFYFNLESVVMFDIRTSYNLEKKKFSFLSAQRFRIRFRFSKLVSEMYDKKCILFTEEYVFTQSLFMRRRKKNWTELNWKFILSTIFCWVLVVVSDSLLSFEH